MKTNIEIITKSVLLPLIVSLFSAIFTCQGEETLDSLLNRVRESTGHKAQRGAWPLGVKAEGEGSAYGLKCGFKFIFLADGRYRIDQISNLGSITGFDGERGWNVDSTGMPYPLEHWGLEVQHLMTWFMGGYWLDESCPLVFDKLSGKDGVANHRISARLPKGVVSATVHIDGNTFLPTKLSWMIYNDENSIELDDYRPVKCFQFPHCITITDSGEETRIHVNCLQEASTAEAEACRIITTRPKDTDFHRDVEAALKLRIDEYGSMLVQPMVNGCGDGWFNLDTGAGKSVIDKSYANQLGMERVGKCTAIGVGGRVDINFVKGKTFILGPMEMRNPIYYEIDFSPRPRDEYRRGGILGYDFFSRCLVEIDPRTNIVSLHAPGAWDNLKVPWRKIIFHDHIPAIECSFSGGHKGLFTLDTGADTSVTFHKHFTDQHNLLEGLKLQKVSLGGVGGRIPCLYGPIDWFELAGHRFEKPEVLFGRGDQGVFTDKVSAGIMGREFLKKFKLLLDYPNGRVAFIELK